MQKAWTNHQCLGAFWREFDRDPVQWPLPDSTLSAFLGKKVLNECAAQTTKQDLIDFFVTGLESVSTHDGMQHKKLLTDVFASLSRARQKRMKQTELHAYLPR
jgi:hypothetical protein